MRRGSSLFVFALILVLGGSAFAVAGPARSPRGAAARACAIVAGQPFRCFRTAAAMDRWITQPGHVLPTANCSTPLKLRDNANQMGTLVSVFARGIWVDLSSLSFDNMTSSYTVGSCAIELAAQSGGAGNHYTRCLSAGCVEDSMLSGWNNVVSSAYLH